MALKARHRADSFELAKWYEHLTFSLLGWLGAAAVGLSPSLHFLLFLSRSFNDYVIHHSPLLRNYERFLLHLFLSHPSEPQSNGAGCSAVSFQRSKHAKLWSTFPSNFSKLSLPKAGDSLITPILPSRGVKMQQNRK